jgi:type IV pilus biogenesis protein PilP
MSNTSSSDAAMKATQRQATEPDALDTGSLSLLGLFGPEGDMRALVRMPGGRVVRVSTGVRLKGGNVVAIDADGLVLLKRGKTQRFTMPGS